MAPRLLVTGAGRSEAMRNLMLEPLGFHARPWEGALRECVSTEIVPFPGR